MAAKSLVEDTSHGCKASRASFAAAGFHMVGIVRKSVRKADSEGNHGLVDYSVEVCRLYVYALDLAFDLLLVGIAKN